MPPSAITPFPGGLHQQPQVLQRRGLPGGRGGAGAQVGAPLEVGRGDGHGLAAGGTRAGLGCPASAAPSPQAGPVVADQRGSELRVHHPPAEGSPAPGRRLLTPDRPAPSGIKRLFFWASSPAASCWGGGVAGPGEGPRNLSALPAGGCLSPTGNLRTEPSALLGPVPHTLPTSLCPGECQAGGGSEE